MADIFYAEKLDGLSSEQQIKLITGIMEKYESSEAFLSRGQFYLEKSWVSYLNVFMKNAQDLEGYNKSLEALNQLPSSSKIKALNGSFYRNYIVTVHNAFVKQARAENYDEAERILKEGLKVFPDDKTLLRDLQMVQAER